jgi:hypothetical protein
VQNKNAPTVVLGLATLIRIPVRNVGGIKGPKRRTLRTAILTENISAAFFNIIVNYL